MKPLSIRPVPATLPRYLAAAVVLAAVVFSPTAFAATPRYEMKRVPMGPRPDQYILVRQHNGDRARLADARTRKSEVKTVRRVVQRWAGARYIGPVWVSERVVEKEPALWAGRGMAEVR